MVVQVTDTVEELLRVFDLLEDIPKKLAVISDANHLGGHIPNGCKLPVRENDSIRFVDDKNPVNGGFGLRFEESVFEQDFLFTALALCDVPGDTEYACEIAIAIFQDARAQQDRKIGAIF